MNYIVSRNYRDRNAPKKWLMRHEDQEPEDAIAVTSLVCKNVKFEMSSAWDRGFGCSIVAKCESATKSKRKKPFKVALRFVYNIFKTADDKEVTQVKSLYLAPDGSVTAVL